MDPKEIMDYIEELARHMTSTMKRVTLLEERVAELEKANDYREETERGDDN